MNFGELANLEGFSVRNMSIDDINRIESMLPKNGIIDINIAERGLVATLEGQNACQEKILKVERIIGFLEGRKNKAWSEAALVTAKAAGHKTSKDKEWYASSDEDYTKCYNEVILAKACKKWLENKASYFSSWHYAFKTFLRRDYSIENSSTLNIGAYNVKVDDTELQNTPSDMCGEPDWK